MDSSTPRPKTRPNLHLPRPDGQDERRPGLGVGRFASEPQHVFRPGDYCTTRYAIMHLLAAGGMAEVYEAFDRVEGQARALKTLQLKHRHNRQIAKRAESEAKTLLEIRHPNLVRVFDAGLDGEIVFFVMELLRGCTLRELLLAHGPLPMALALDLLLQLANGVHALHTIGVIHRDLKPENAFVVRPEAGDTALRLKLLDLGAAKFEHRHHVTTSNLYTLGTAQYMSPEQSSGQSKIDARTDVYALGLILFEVLTGVHPARLQPQPPLTAGEWTSWHIHYDKPDLDPTLEDAPPALVQLARAALQKDAARRIPDARTFANALAAIRRDLPSAKVDEQSGVIWPGMDGAPSGSDEARLRLVVTSDVSPRVPFASTDETAGPPPRARAPRDTVRLDAPPVDSIDPPSEQAARDDAEALALLTRDERPTVRMDDPRERPKAARGLSGGEAPARVVADPVPHVPRAAPASVIVAKSEVSRRSASGPGTRTAAREARRLTLRTLYKGAAMGLGLATVLVGLGAIAGQLWGRGEQGTSGERSTPATAAPAATAPAATAGERGHDPRSEARDHEPALPPPPSASASASAPRPSVTAPAPTVAPPASSTSARPPASPPARSGPGGPWPGGATPSAPPPAPVRDPGVRDPWEREF